MSNSLLEKIMGRLPWASLGVSWAISAGYWLWTLRSGRVSWPVGERLVLFFWLFLSFSIVGMILSLGIGLVQRGSSSLLPRWRVPGGRAAIAAINLCFWMGLLGAVRLALHGIYYEDWGIESRWVALALRSAQWLLLVLAVVLACWGLLVIFQRLGEGRIPQLFFLLGAFLLALGVVLPGSASSPPFQGGTVVPPSPPVALFGFDGLSWDLLRKFSADLPTFRRMERECATASMETLALGSSPLIWNTISTGVAPSVHGVGGHAASRFRGMDHWVFFPHQTGFNHILAPLLEKLGVLERRPQHSGDRRRAAFWDLARLYDLETVMVGWYGSWPVEEVPGVNVSRFAERLLAASEEPAPVAMKEFVHPESYGWRLRTWLRKRPRKTGGLDFRRRTLGKSLKKVKDAELIAVYSSFPDSVQHRWWHHHDPEKFFYDLPEVSEELKDPLREIYRRVDRNLAAFIEKIPRDTTYMVLSDHGAGPVFGQWHTKGDHVNAPNAYLAICGPEVKPGTNLQDVTVYDILPTLAWLKRIPSSREWSGRVLEEAFELNQPWVVGRTVEGYGPDLLVRGQERGESPKVEQEVIEQLKALGYLN